MQKTQKRKSSTILRDIVETEEDRRDGFDWTLLKKPFGYAEHLSKYFPMDTKVSVVQNEEDCSDMTEISLLTGFHFKKHKVTVPSNKTQIVGFEITNIKKSSMDLRRIRDEFNSDHSKIAVITQLFWKNNGTVLCLYLESYNHKLTEPLVASFFCFM